MPEIPIAEAKLPSDLLPLFEETPWPAALLGASGQVLTLNRPMRALLGPSAAAVVGEPAEALAPPHERARMRGLVEQALGGQAPARIRGYLQHGQAPLRVELDAIAAPHGQAQLVTLLVHPVSLAHRREQLLLEINRLAPALMAEPTADDVFRHVAQSLEPLGLGLAIGMQGSDRASLQLHHAAHGSALVEHLAQAAGISLAKLQLPVANAGADLAKAKRRASFWADFEPLLRQIAPQQAVASARPLLRLLGIRGLILAPILVDQRLRGGLLVWSCMLSRKDTPFIEALAHQIAAVLGQIELRQRTAAQIERLESLATTAQAVTTLGGLQDVLRVICQQAQTLLGAEFARLALPIAGTDTLKYAMSVGFAAPALHDMPIPLDDSLSGEVLKSGRGRWIPDLQAEPRVYAPVKSATAARSVLYQPLRHQGEMLGVLIVGHRQTGRFSQADLDYLARYAEYAAVAVANARLHAALQQSEAEQRRQHMELAALLHVSEALNRMLDMDAILNEGLRILDELQLITLASVYLYDQQTSAFTLCAARNLSPELVARFAHLPLERLQFGDALLRRGQLHLAADEMAEINRAYPDMAMLGLSSVGVFQLISEQRLLGALVVNRTDGRSYSEHEQRLLEGIAGLLAQAVGNAQQHQALVETASANARLYREAEGTRSYLNTLIRYTPDVLLTISQNMALHALNPDQLAAITGYRPDQIEGRPFLELIPERLRADLLARWRKVASGQPQTLETEIICAAGPPLIVILSAALLPDYGDVFVIVKNVTEQRRLEHQLQQSEKLAALGRLIAGAAHELNNPLATILGLAQLQLLDELPPAIKADMLNIERAAQRASQILQHLRMFVAPGPPLAQALDLAALIDTVLWREAPHLAAHAIEVARDLPPGLPAIVADAAQIEQALFNIIRNAILALADLPPCAPRLLALAAMPVERCVRLAISDSGPGIAADVLPRIFEPFFTTRRIGEGAGLGLSIVHTIVQQHGGHVWAESDAGQGTTFYVELPAIETFSEAQNDRA